MCRELAWNYSLLCLSQLTERFMSTFKRGIARQGSERHSPGRLIGSDRDCSPFTRKPDEPALTDRPRRWRTKGEYATLFLVVLRTCIVAVRDIRDVEHSTEVTAETLYEAIAMALAVLQQDNWVGEIGQGFTTVTVVVQQPPVKHEVKMKDFVSWLGRQGRSHAEVILKQKLEKILGKVNHART